MWKTVKALIWVRLILDFNRFKFFNSGIIYKKEITIKKNTINKQ